MITQRSRTADSMLDNCACEMSFAYFGEVGSGVVSIDLRGVSSPNAKRGGKSSIINHKSSHSCGRKRYVYCWPRRYPSSTQATKAKFNTFPWSFVKYSCTSRTVDELVDVYTPHRTILTRVSEDASLSSRQYSLLHFLQVRIKSSLQLMHVWPQPKQSCLTPITCVSSRQHTS